MNIKKLLKKISILERLNTRIKGHQQEKRNEKEIEYYKRKLGKTVIKIRDDREIRHCLIERLRNRGIFLTPKVKGELHIFLCFGINNWESVLPLAMKPFGHVTTFSWPSVGFFYSGDEWLAWRDELNIKMMNVFNDAHEKRPIDIMVGYVSEFNINNETLIQIRKKGVIILNMNWDDKAFFSGGLFRGQPRSIIKLIPYIDLNLTNAPDSCMKYIAEGGLAVFWPEGAFPPIHRPYKTQFLYDVSFVGTKNIVRSNFIENIRKKGVKVETFGRGWPSGPLSDNDIIKLYSMSKINLGFAGVGYSKKIMCLKGRDFEIPMSGGLYLTQNNPELALVYKVGQEVAIYDDAEDCARKICYLLNNPDIAEKIRKSGRRRALKDHTWGKRFADIFYFIGLLRKENNLGS